MMTPLSTWSFWAYVMRTLGSTKNRATGRTNTILVLYQQAKPTKRKTKQQQKNKDDPTATRYLFNDHRRIRRLAIGTTVDDLCYRNHRHGHRDWSSQRHRNLLY